MSWRQSTSQEAQAGMDALFSQSLGMAVNLLDKNKEFYPFGFTLSKSNEMRTAAISTTGEKRPEMTKVLTMLKEDLVRTRNDYNAVAVVYAVRTNTNADAIAIDIENSEGTAIQILVPYKMKGIVKKTANVNMQQASTQITDRFIW